MEIIKDDLSGPEIAVLLNQHLAGMALNSPPGSIHALDLEALRQPDITFWSAWQDSELLGCGALKELDHQRGEIKSMRTAAAHIRRGVAANLLQHIIATATARGYRQLSLETGSAPAFEPARRLYMRFGFEECGPFANYILDPHSVFMTRLIS